MTTEASFSRYGFPLVISAPSASGKTTLIKKLRAEFSLSFSVSCTTRPPREGEENGKDYFFLSQEEFLQKRENGDFAEWAKVHGHYYGTPLKPVLDQLALGQDMVFDIDIQGAAQLLLALPSASFVFILPPSLQVLEQRLRDRGTEDEQAIATRLANARSEIANCHWFNAWIINDSLETAYEQLRAFYLSCTLRPALQPGMVRMVLGEQ